MSGAEYVLDIMRRVAPQIPRCAGAGDWTYDLVQKALDFDCTKIQLYTPHFQYHPENYVEDICRRAHEKGIRILRQDPFQIGQLRLPDGGQRFKML